MEKAVQRSSAGPQTKRKIRNFLIDRTFQLGWVFRVAVVAAIIVGVMGYFLYSTLAESAELIAGQALGLPGMAPEAQNAIIEQGEKDKLYSLLVLTSGLLGLVVLLSMMTIVATHKIAGPAYKMKRLFSQVTGERMQLWEKLRKGDELHDIFYAFNDMLKRLRESRHMDTEKLESVVALLEEEGVSPDKLAPLKEISEKFKKSVAMD